MLDFTVLFMTHGPKKGMYDDVTEILFFFFFGGSFFFFFSAVVAKINKNIPRSDYEYCTLFFPALCHPFSFAVVGKPGRAVVGGGGQRDHTPL